jgi:hypothetical protein
MGEVARGGQGVGMVGAEEAQPAIEQLFVHGSAAVAVAVGLQIPASVQKELPGGG